MDGKLGFRATPMDLLWLRSCWIFQATTSSFTGNILIKMVIK